MFNIFSYLIQKSFSIISILKEREYRLFWIGAVFSNLGMWILIAGRLWLMHLLTGSATMLGLLTFANTIPILIFSMWGGVLADKFNRLQTIRFTRSLFALQAFVTAALIIANLMTPWLLITIAFLTGMLLAFDIPARQSIIADIVPKSRLLEAIVLYSIIFGASSVIGPAFFGPLVSILGIASIFIVIGITYVVTVITLLMMKQLKVRELQATGSTWENLLAGLSYVRQHRLISGLLLLSASGGIFGYSFTTVLPAFVDQILAGEVESYSTLLFGLGIGGIIGTGTTGFLKAKTSPWTVQSIVAIGTGAGLILFSQTTSLLFSVAAICILGLFTAVFRTSNNAFIQQSVEDQYRGRVMSIHQLSWGITSIGGLFTGALSSYAGVSTALMISGLLFLGLSLAIVLLRKPDRISQR